MQQNPGAAQPKTPGHKPLAARMSLFKHILPNRRRSSARRYRPSGPQASRRRSAAPKWGKGVYLTVIVVGILVAIGGGFGIGVAIYPNIISSASIQDSADSIPTIDVLSDNAADDDGIIISDPTTPSANQPRGKRCIEPLGLGSTLAS